MPSQTLPTFYITHGGGPAFWIDYPPPIGPENFESLRVFFDGLLATLPERPKAILMISAHWEAEQPTVGTTPNPGMIYDYYGFPPVAYTLQHPAPGAPELGDRVLELLAGAGIEAVEDKTRGFDHGTFVPLMIIDAEAQIPVLTMSLEKTLDPERHIAIGHALQPLRNEGVLVIGSGSSFHNLRAIFSGRAAEAEAFDEWLNDAVTTPDIAERDRRLIAWQNAPHARFAHPREEHLIPLMVAAGAGGQSPARNVYRKRIGGVPYSCFAFG